MRIYLLMLLCFLFVPLCLNKKLGQQFHRRSERQILETGSGVETLAEEGSIQDNPSSSETQDSASGDSTYDQEDDYSCYSTCIALTSNAQINIDTYLKHSSEVKQTDLATTCPMYQAAKNCVKDCPISNPVNNFNEIYKLVTFLCVDRLTEANRYFACTLNDNRDYESECDTTDNSNEASGAIQPENTQDTQSDVTIYCKSQRCIMSKKLIVLQQRCPDIVQFARNYYKVDLDITESSQEYGSLWTTECMNLQKDLASNNPI